MIKKWRRWLWLTGIATSLGLAGTAKAQTNTFQPLKALFGGKTAEQKTTAHRLTEIQIELAWLSDKITFPYYLEAHVKGTNLEVRGYVPSKVVRQPALSLAKLNCPLMVIDALKEHPSLVVHTVRRPSEQLKSSVETALGEAFPGQHFDVACLTDGTVRISGFVRSIEQKLAVSAALRRLHGCTNVANFTEVGGGDVARQPAAAAAGAARASSIAPRPEPPGIATTEPKVPTAITHGPYESRGVVVVSSDESINVPVEPAAAAAVVPTPTPQAVLAAPLTAAQLKRRIEAAVPVVHNVMVSFTSNTDVRIECATRTGEDSGPIAGQILSLRELDPYTVDLQIQLPKPER